MAQNGADTSDQDESTKPVSFLLSHFENLSQVNRPSHTPESPSTTSSPLLKAPSTADAPAPGRVSLDIPRPDTEWSSSHTPSRSYHGIGRSPPPPPVQTESHSASPNRAPHARPLSMFAEPTSGRNPTLTVESPRSPPKNPPNRQGGQNTAIAGAPSRGDTGEFRNVSHRAATPDVSDSNDSGKPPRTSPVPPPVNRADKPKIFAKKPSIAPSTDTNLTPAAPSSQRTSFEERVSPFSTPPSSPEGPSPPKNANGRASNHTRSSSRPLDSATTRRSYMEPPPDLSLSGSKPVETSGPAFSRSTKAGASARRSAVQPPLPPPSVKRNATLPTRPPPRDISGKQDAGGEPADRPGLPRRSPALDTQRRPSQPVHSINTRDAEPASASLSPDSQPASAGPTRQSLQLPRSEAKAPLPAPHRRDVRSGGAGRTQDEKTSASLSPSRSQENIDSTSAGGARRHLTDRAREESVERQPRADDVPVSRMDYPDATHTNRRPPSFRTGTRGIHTKHDTRVYDVCGQYVCTTGFFTRAWDLITGEPVMSLSHGESLKGLSIAFKPGQTLDDEGRYVWVGTNTGELLEVDITKESVVSSRSSPSRREIIKIYRYKKELWTLDDEGKLLLWPPDESGAPNLQFSYRNPHDRVARGHTFSMVVGDILWYATGKEVRLYRPNTNDSSFQLFKTPLGKNHSGDVTCGAVAKDGDCVFLGHADGKVTIYSTRDYSCLGTVNVSLYKISSLTTVGDYLWAGFKTGMIYVYNTKTNPWTVQKDWLAHDNGVVGMILDPSAIWTVNRLQLVSLGVDNYIRVWDGMLEDDWLESRMRSRDVEYCQFREITTAVLTWNAGAITPSHLRDSDFIRDVIHPEDPPDILVFGFQELVDLEDKKITAKSLFKSGRKKEHADAEHMSRQYRVWRDHLTSVIQEHMPLDQPYVLLYTANLIGLFTCVFIKQKERQRIRDVGSATVKRGMGGLHGNKGALVLRFLLDDSSVCFVNCHLAAGQTQTASRNNDIAAIMESDALPSETSRMTCVDLYTGGGDGSMIMDHEICILNGDLNYRIDSIPRNTVLEAIKSQNLPKLLDRDQLLASRRKNPGFRLRAFNEMPITFAPTYKYDVGTDNYDSSEKKRAPAWCDRLLYRGVGRIKQTEYRRHEVRVSDHRPVSGLFKMRVKTISTQKRDATWELCQEEFVHEKRRMATEASIDYLVRVVGTTPQQARSLISSSDASNLA